MGYPKGKLVIIGGHEDKKGDKVILKEVATLAQDGGKPLVLVTVATQSPEKMEADYRRVFSSLGLDKIDLLDIRTRDHAHDPELVQKVKNASLIFFTGGDQLRITSQIGDSPIYQEMCAFYKKGGTIVGTSAGAAAMPDTMIVAGGGDETNEISALGMAPGLAFVHDVVIDSHFAQRGRISRLLGAVAQNPKNLGIGIDEDTAIILEDHHFQVIGSGGIYVIDGTDIAYSSLSERTASGILSIFNCKLHVLGEGDRFDLNQRVPIIPQEASIEK